MVFRPRPMTARFIEVLNKTLKSKCSDINQSIPVHRALHRCYFIGGGTPVDLGQRRRHADRI